MAIVINKVSSNFWNMRKIVLLLPSLPKYRIDFLNSLHGELLKDKIELIVFHGSTKKKSILTSNEGNFNVVPLKTFETTLCGVTVTFLKDLKKKIKHERPTGVVVLFNPAILSFVDVLLYCKKHHIPYGIWSCGYVRPKINGLVEKIRNVILDFFDQKAQIHIAYHSLRKESLLSKGIDNSKIFIAQNTINIESIVSSYDLNEINAKRFNDALNILFVGALIENKNLKTAMRAVETIIEKNNNISFTIVGGGQIYNDLIEYRNCLLHKEHFHILGPKYGEELRSLFLKSDLFLLTGSGGLAINEAMAYGLPIISTIGDGSIKDLIYENGYLLSQIEDVNEIMKCILNFIALPKEKKIRMSEASYERIQNTASLNNMVVQYKNSILQLINED